MLHNSMKMLQKTMNFCDDKSSQNRISTQPMQDTIDLSHDNNQVFSNDDDDDKSILFNVGDNSV